MAISAHFNYELRTYLIFSKMRDATLKDFAQPGRPKLEETIEIRCFS